METAKSEPLSLLCANKVSLGRSWGLTDHCGDCKAEIRAPHEAFMADQSKLRLFTPLIAIQMHKVQSTCIGSNLALSLESAADHNTET